MSKTQIKKIYDQFKAFQSELNKGIPFKIKIGNKNLEVLITSLNIYGTSDKLYITAHNYEIDPLCELSKWAMEYAGLCFYDYVSDDEIEKLVSSKFFKTRLSKLQKEIETSGVTIAKFAFLYFYNRANFNNFYADYLESINDKKNKATQTVEIHGVKFTKEELVNIMKQFEE